MQCGHPCNHLCMAGSRLLLGGSKLLTSSCKPRLRCSEWRLFDPRHVAEGAPHVNAYVDEASSDRPGRA